MAMPSSLLRLFGFVGICAAWLIPNHAVPWSSAYNESAAVVGLLLLALSLGKRLFSSRPTRVAAAVLVVGTIPTTQYFAKQLDFSGDAWIATLYLVMFALAISVGNIAASRRLLARAEIDDVPSLATGLAAATLVGAVLSAIIAILQISHWSVLSAWIVGITQGDRALGNLAQPNNLGTLLGLGAVGLLLLVEQRRVGHYSASALLLLLTVGAALSLSRTAFFFGPLVLGVLWCARRHGTELRIAPQVVVVATALQWSVAVLWAFIGPRFAPEALSLVSRGLGTARSQGWTILLDSSRLEPWQGYGWLQVGAAELATVNRHPPIEELWLHGHNLLLELVIWCGYPLGLSIGAMVVVWALTRLQRLASTEAALGFCAIAIVAFHALLELPHHYLYFLVPIGLWIGVVEADVGRGRALPRGFTILPLTLGFGLFIAIAKDYPTVEEDFRLMRFETLRIGTLKAAQPAPDAPFLSSLTSFLRFARSTPHEGMSVKEIDGMEAITKRYPYGPSLLKVATALALNGREHKARERIISIRHLFGEVSYRQLRAELRRSIDDGRYPSLDSFEVELPD